MQSGSLIVPTRHRVESFAPARHRVWVVYDLSRVEYEVLWAEIRELSRRMNVAPFRVLWPAERRMDDSEWLLQEDARHFYELGDAVQYAISRDAHKVTNERMMVS